MRGTRRRRLCAGATRARRSHVTVATLICRRPFLAGRYDSRALAQRDRLNGLRACAEEALAEAFAETHECALSARAAEKALTLDPYRERLHRRLDRSHVLAGDAPGRRVRRGAAASSWSSTSARRPGHEP